MSQNSSAEAKSTATKCGCPNRFSASIIDIYILFFSYSVMLQCWTETPDLRPSFAQLVKTMSSYLLSKADYMPMTDNKERDIQAAKEILAESSV